MIRILWNCKKSLSTVVMQNIKRVFILFLQIIHTDFRSSYLHPSTLKRLNCIIFLVKNCLSWNSLFKLHLQVCFYVGKKTEKQQSYFKKLCYLTCEQVFLKLPKVLKFQMLIFNPNLSGVGGGWGWGNFNPPAGFPLITQKQ